MTVTTLIWFEFMTSGGGTIWVVRFGVVTFLFLLSPSFFVCSKDAIFEFEFCCLEKWAKMNNGGVENTINSSASVGPNQS
jgi:hypothetical protein